ncbi:hypothetical protein NC651_004041 [Populus alba x Populus x berolinensis]|nr:hypothetical protein NC651_004041 [Populus alba x Populus x berolinensis]
METISQKQTRGRLQPPARQSLGEGNRVRRIISSSGHISQATVNLYVLKPSGVSQV